MFRLARHLARTDEIGDAVVGADLDDLHELLGRRPDSWLEGEAELERFVLADAEHRQSRRRRSSPLFHRRHLRAQMLLGPPGSAMARHLPIQPFRELSARRCAGPVSPRRRRPRASADAPGWRAVVIRHRGRCATVGLLAEVDLVLLELTEITGARHGTGVPGGRGDLPHLRGVLDVDRLDLVVVAPAAPSGGAPSGRSAGRAGARAAGWHSRRPGRRRRWPSPRPWPRR